MKIFFALLFISCLAKNAYSQNRKLDSMDNLIRKATTDTAKINLTNKKITIVNRTNIDSGIDLSKKTIEKAKSISYKNGEAAARLNLATGYCMKGTYTLAAENLQISNNIYRALKDSDGLCATYSGYGMMYGMQSKYDTSIQYIEKAIGIAERNNFIDKLPTEYGNIAIGYQMQSNFLRALKYQQKALDLAKAQKDIIAQAYTTLNMGLTYSSMGDTLRSRQFIIESIRLAKSQGLKNVELYAWSNLATLYTTKEDAGKSYEYSMKAARLGREMGDYGIESASLSKASGSLADMGKIEEAETMAKQAITIADSTGQAYNIYQAYDAMGSVLKKQQKYKEAIQFYLKSFASIKDADTYDKGISNTYREISECYEKTGDYGDAFKAYKKYAEIKDSIRSKDNIQKATELTMNYEFDKKQQETKAEQDRINDTATIKQTALIVGLALTLALAVIAFRGYRNKQKANTLLHQQKEEIENTLVKLKAAQTQLIQSEKMASLGELTAGIAHEIQNPLNFVNNFSEVNAELIDELKNEKSKLKSERDEELEDELLRNIQQNLVKINHHGKRADAIVKGMLQHSRAGSGTKVPTDLNALADEYLRISYHGLRVKDKLFNATLQTDFDPNLGKINIVSQDIGRVLLNLFTNAFYEVAEKKKKQHHGYQPTVSISTKRITSPLREESIEVTVKDNGNGIPQKVMEKIFQPFFTTKPTGQGTGLGLSLSYDIIKVHGGEIKVETKDGEGTEFIIKLPFV